MIRKRLVVTVASLAAVAAGAVGTFNHTAAAGAIARYVFSPIPIAQPGTLSSGQTVSGTVTAEDASNAPIPNATIYLSFTSIGVHPGGASTGSATAGPSNTPLTSTPTAFTANGSGVVNWTYTAPCVGGSGCPVEGRDVITAQDSASSPTVTKTDSYSFSRVASYSFTPNPIAASGSLAPGDTVSLTVTALDATGTPVANATIYLSIISSASPSGTAKATDQSSMVTKTLTSTPKTFFADSNGSVPITYTAPNPLPAGGADTITAQDRGSSPTTSASDSYTFGPGGSAWAGPHSLGAAPLGGDPHAVSTGVGHTYVFWRGADNSLWNETYNASAGGWSAHGLGGSGASSLAGDPHPVATGNGTVDVFYMGEDGNLWHVYEVGNGAFTAPIELGGGPLGSDPMPASSGQGDVAVFWKGTDNNLWEAAYLPSTGWRLPLARGDGPLGGTPHPVAYNTDSYDVFWRGGDNNIWHDHSAGGPWSGAQVLGMGPINSDPVGVSAAANVIDLYWIGTDGSLWHAWYNTRWAGPQGLGGTVSSLPSPISPNPGQVDVFWRSGSTLAHLVSNTPVALTDNNVTGTPSAFSWGSGHEEAFWVGSDNALWHDWTH
jgi:hypothetical protein